MNEEELIAALDKVIEDSRSEDWHYGGYGEDELRTLDISPGQAAINVVEFLKEKRLLKI